MSKRIDHVSKALRSIEGLHDYQAEEGMTGESMLTVALEAQAHATLALVEQQRIANLIAARAQSESPRIDLRGDSNSHDMVQKITDAEIRKALGLS